MKNLCAAPLGVLSLLSLVACSPDVPKLIPNPDVTYEKIDTDGGEEVFDPKLDILFVVDDSGSMMGHQTNLSNNIFAFVNGFVQRRDIDFHVGVLTTSMDGWDYSTECCGELVDKNRRGSKFVTPATPDAVTALASNLRVGTNGSWKEQSFAPVRAALSSPLLNGLNAGFYRPEAHLAIIFITDAEDQSGSLTAQGLWDFLLKLKGRPDKILSFGVIVPSTETRGCARDSTEKPYAIEEFLRLSGQGLSNVFSLCDPQFSDNLVQIADLVLEKIGNIIYLSRAPILRTVEVTFGTQIIPPHPYHGWSYSPHQNALILGEGIEWTEQPPGTRVKVNYEAAAFPKESN